PLQIAPVRLGPVRFNSRRFSNSPAQRVRCNSHPFVNHLQGVSGVAKLDLSTKKVARHTVIVIEKLDVIVVVHPAPFPMRNLESSNWKRFQRWPVQLLEQLPPTPRTLSELPRVQLLQQSFDRLIEFTDAGEDPFTQRSQYPALDYLHSDLDLCFVFWFSDPRRYYCDPIVRSHLLVSRVQVRLVT